MTMKLSQFTDEELIEEIRYRGIKIKNQISEKKLDELAHSHCINNGYYGCYEDEYIEDHSTTYGDVMNDIENAYKAGYYKANE